MHPNVPTCDVFFKSFIDMNLKQCKVCKKEVFSKQGEYTIISKII